MPVKERPIIFSSPMVRAIIEGRKTQTRRLIRYDWLRCLDPDDVEDRAQAVALCPHGSPGDHLWVRERHQIATGKSPGDLGAAVRYENSEIRACWMPKEKSLPLGLGFDRWRPSIHMPRWASRITLEVKSVRIERLQDISEADAKAEGIVPLTSLHSSQPILGDPQHRTQGSHPYTLALAVEWDLLNGERAPWKSNPWVWVIGFEPIEVKHA